jgi:hypothetical protein
MLLLSVQVIDTQGYTNMKEIQVTVQSTDKESPYFIPEQSKVKRRTDAEGGEQKEVNLIFNDHLSAVIGGTVSVDGEVISTFEGRLATFTVSAAVAQVQVQVKDAYENVLQETIDLTEI